LSELYDNEDSKDALEFFIKDLDNNGIPELIIVKNGVDISVYAYGDTVGKVGDKDFFTGTTRLLYSENSSYPGIFYFYVSGGLNHYWYMTIKDNRLVDEELWNEDYSGITKELGENRGRIKEISADKQLIEESRTAYKENKDLPLQKLHPSNF
jgi:hypothetical protein